MAAVEGLVLVVMDCAQMQGHSDFKKLIQIGGNDTQISQSLQKRHVSSLCPIEHSLIECQKTLVSRQKLILFRVAQISIPRRLNSFKDRVILRQLASKVCRGVRLWCPKGVQSHDQERLTPPFRRDQSPKGADSMSSGLDQIAQKQITRPRPVKVHGPLPGLGALDLERLMDGQL